MLANSKTRSVRDVKSRVAKVAKSLQKHNMMQRLKKNKNIELHPRYDYFDFIKLLGKAEFLATDGGSNQEECSYLGKPCLLLRHYTERQEGLAA